MVSYYFKLYVKKDNGDTDVYYRSTREEVNDLMEKLGKPEATLYLVNYRHLPKMPLWETHF